MRRRRKGEGKELDVGVQLIFVQIGQTNKTFTVITRKTKQKTITCPKEFVSDPGLVKPGVFVTEF